MKRLKTETGRTMNGSIGVAIGSDSVTATAVGDHRAPVSVPATLAFTPTGARLINTPTGWAGSAGTGAVYQHFLDRVGDPVPVIGSTGEARLGADLVATTIASIVGNGPDQITIARPAHWSAYQRGALRAALDRVELPAQGISLVSAPLAALVGMDLPRPEAVIVAEIDASATEVSLVTDFAKRAPRVLETIRVDSMGVDALDRRLACHVLAQLNEPVDRPARAKLLARCRIARAELANQTATTVPVQLGHGGRQLVRVVRAEFESLSAEPVNSLAAAIARAITRAREHATSVDAVVLVGAGARIPLLIETLTTTTRARLIVPPDPTRAVARGAAQLAARAHRALPTRPDRTRPPAQPATPRRIGSLDGHAQPEARNRRPANGPAVRQPQPTPLTRIAAAFCRLTTAQ
jgi:actin-like ATPase involved in cell morphogenesis